MKANRIQGYETADSTSKDARSVYERHLKHKSRKKKLELEEAEAGITPKRKRVQNSLANLKKGEVSMSQKQKFNYPLQVEHRDSRVTLPSLKPKAGGASGYTRAEFDYFERKEGKKADTQHSFLNELVGKQVKLSFVSGKEMSGTLRWFDQFTLAIEIEGAERMIFKHAVVSMEAT